MVQVTMQLPDQLANRVLPAQRWMPALLELSLLRLKTPARETASELADFLLSNPSLDAVLGYYVSNRAQTRLQRLLALNEAGLVGEMEQLELDELEQLEHIMVMLKAQIAEQQHLDA